MLKKIAKKLGFVPLKESKEAWSQYAQMKGRYEAVVKDLTEKNAILKGLKTDLFRANQRETLPHPVIDVNIKDVEPSDVEKRQLYVGQIAGLHTDILKSKLISMIADAREQFEQINRETYGYSQEQYDLFLKGTINGLWLIHDWGDSMVNEQIANQTQPSELSDDEMSDLKDKIN